MSITSLLLEQFTQPTFVCRQNDSIAELWERWRISAHQKSLPDRLVVVNEENAPLGIISWGHLLPHFMEEQTPPTDPRSRSEREQHSATPRESWWQQPLSALDPEAIAPVQKLRAPRDWNQFWHALQTQSAPKPIPQEWALVDGAGKFLGLLDSSRLLGYLAQHPSLRFHAGEDPPLQPVALAHPLDRLPPLAELLEEIPLPMKLQTDEGNVLSYNQAWRKQFELQAESQPIGEPPAPSGEATDIPQEHNVGMCPMPNPQDRVWEFVKIPLGATPIGSPAQLRSGHRHPGAEQWNPNLRAPPSLGTGKIPLSLPSDPASGAIDVSHSPEEGLWLVLAQDVTDRQQVAKELAAKNADLMQLNRLKDEFLACISHELKTPLTAVLGLSSLLKERTLGDLNDRQARYAQMIYQSGRHLMNVVNDILDLTRIESGQMELIQGVVQIAEVCDRAFEQALHEAAKDTSSTASNSPADSEDPHTQFTVEIEPGLTTIIADELRLRQMLYNLLSNALKFTPAEGTLGLKVNRWEGWIAFTVWDTGMGIPAQKQHLIFQKFQQLENPMTRQFEGTGLGLVLTQRLARAHGGDVSFISKEGVGSEFTLLLPPSPPQPTTALGESATPPNRLILIVEAVPRYIEELTEQLTALGYRVAIARAGTEAVEKARRLQPRAIFLNSLLPMLSGWDVLTLLKGNERTHHIPAIVMATEVDKQRAKDAEADGCLSLPVKLASLQKCLDKLNALPVLEERSPTPTTKLTILCLSPLESDAVSETLSSPATRSETLGSELNHLLGWGSYPQLAHHHYRVLEADDLEQAEILARVWHLDAILLDTAAVNPNPVAFIEQLSQYPALAATPLVTLDRATSDAALQVPGLTVFPCVNCHKARREGQESSLDPAALLQAIEVAAGIGSKPTILAIDISSLPEFAPVSSESVSGAIASPGSEPLSPDSTHHEWLQAAIQYIQTAGFKGIVGGSWSEVLHQLQHHSVDLLLICLGSDALKPRAIEALTTLDRLSEKPAILILDRTPEFTATGETSPKQPHPILEQMPEFKVVLQEISTAILPPSLSMQELLDRINQTLK